MGATVSTSLIWPFLDLPRNGDHARLLDVGEGYLGTAESPELILNLQL